MVTGGCDPAYRGRTMREAQNDCSGFSFFRDEIVCLFTDLDSLYCTVILIIWINRTGNTCCLPVCATPHTGVEPCVGPKTIVVGFPRIVIIGLLALAKTGRRFTGLE